MDRAGDAAMPPFHHGTTRSHPRSPSTLSLPPPLAQAPFSPRPPPRNNQQRRLRQPPGLGYCLKTLPGQQHASMIPLALLPPQLGAGTLAGRLLGCRWLKQGSAADFGWRGWEEVPHTLREGTSFSCMGRVARRWENAWLMKRSYALLVRPHALLSLGPKSHV